MKSWFKDIGTNMKIFNKIYQKINNDLLNKHEQIILQAVREQYRIVNDMADHPYKDVWNILKDVMYFSIMFFFFVTCNE